jgi:hypothetical protein
MRSANQLRSTDASGMRRAGRSAYVGDRRPRLTRHYVDSKTGTDVPKDESGELRESAPPRIDRGVRAGPYEAVG